MSKISSLLKFGLKTIIGIVVNKNIDKSREQKKYVRQKKSNVDGMPKKKHEQIKIKVIRIDTLLFDIKLVFIKIK